MARVPAGRPAGPALRIPHGGHIRAETRPIPQSGQAARRPLRPRDRRRLHRPSGGVWRQRGRLGSARATIRRRRRHVLMGTGSAPRRAVGRHGDLRAARAGLHPATSGDPRTAARHVRRPRPSGGGRVPARTRHHGRRADADPPVRVRAGRAAPWHAELLGLQLPRLLRTARGIRGRVRARRGRARVQDDGALAARGRHRGHPRRRLQPHLRRRPGRTDPVVPRHRQPGVLPALAGRSVALPRLHGLRQHVRPAPAVPLAADHRLAAVLDHRDARGRVPVRPRLGAGALTARCRQAVVLLRHDPPGSRYLTGETHRRAVGRRRRRLPGRRLPSTVDGVERQVPRHRPLVLGPRIRRRARSRIPAERLVRPLRRRRPSAVRVDQLHHRARRVHPARPGQLRAKAQRGQRRRQPRRHRRQPLLQLWSRG